jgi:hypothetical protein
MDLLGSFEIGADFDVYGRELLGQKLFPEQFGHLDALLFGRSWDYDAVDIVLAHGLWFEVARHPAGRAVCLMGGVVARLGSDRT